MPPFEEIVFEVEDGSYLDGYGLKHYAYGNSYKIAPFDKRLTANGAYSGKQIVMSFTPEERKANPFLGLGPRDYQTVMLYMQGMSRREIATELEVCEQTVTTRLAKPDVKSCLREAKLMQEEDLHSLVGDATNVLRDAVSPSQPIGTRLAAARDILKVTGHADKKVVTSAEETSTSQMQKVLQMLKVEVNVNTDSARKGLSSREDQEGQENDSGSREADLVSLPVIEVSSGESRD